MLFPNLSRIYASFQFSERRVDGFVHDFQNGVKFFFKSFFYVIIITVLKIVSTVPNWVCACISSFPGKWNKDHSNNYDGYDNAFFNFDTFLQPGTLCLIITDFPSSDSER